MPTKSSATPARSRARTTARPNKSRKLEVSVHTVKFDVASLLRKLGADGRLEAVGIGLSAGLLMP